MPMHARSVLADPGHHKGSWTKPTVEESKAFLALLFLTGVVRKPHLKMYWSSSELNATPIFTRLMPRDGYVQIMRYSKYTYNIIRIYTSTSIKT